MRVVAAVAALLLTASYLYVNADDNCVLTDAPPQAVREGGREREVLSLIFLLQTNGLNFCRKYTKKACCHPPHDLELEDALHSLLGQSGLPAPPSLPPPTQVSPFLPFQTRETVVG